MFEIFKLAWDVVVLRDAQRKGQLDWRVFAYGVGFAVFLYATLIPAFVFYDKHPQYKPLFIAVLAVDAIAFIAFMTWAIRWYLHTLAAQRGKAADQNNP